MSKLTAIEQAEKWKQKLIDGGDRDYTVDGESLELLIRAVLAKPVPAGELGEAMKLAQGLVKIEIDEKEHSRTTVILFKAIIKPLAESLLALAAENAQLKQGWTAVADGLPEKKERVLIFTKFDETFCATRDNDYLGDDEWDWILHGIQHADNKKSPFYVIKQYVTHWQPLPEPPEPKKKITLAEARQKNSEHLKAMEKERKQAFIDNAGLPEPGDERADDGV